ncbi:MAG: hypothetical protein LCH32_01670 [Bacteroidetes bacterium]|nr:hypothetical protein [Bacteroidota bacterium]
MEKAFIEYLETIGIKGDLLPKIENIYTFFEKYLEYKIENIFVSEYINKEGGRVYENLWFFNSDFCFEAKQFNTQEDFDSCILKHNIDYYSIKKTDFDIISNSTTDNSRMNLEFHFKNSSIGGDMKASRENCKKLSEIFKTYIKINHVK